MTRRKFLQCGVGTTVALSLPYVSTHSAAVPGLQRKLAKYVQPLPVPGAGIVVATPNGFNQYSFVLKQIARQLHPDLPPTPLWAYDDGSGLVGQAGSFGMAVVAQKNVPLAVSFRNKLPGT